MDTPARAQDVFFGAGDPSTVERLRICSLSEELDGDETLLMGNAGTPLVPGSHQLTLFLSARSRNRVARGPSPLKATFRPQSSPESTAGAKVGPSIALWRPQPQKGRKSVALIDFDGELASPGSAIPTSGRPETAPSLLDDPFSPMRPPGAVESLPRMDLGSVERPPLHGTPHRQLTSPTLCAGTAGLASKTPPLSISKSIPTPSASPTRTHRPERSDSDKRDGRVQKMGSLPENNATKWSQSYVAASSSSSRPPAIKEEKPREYTRTAGAERKAPLAASSNRATPGSAPKTTDAVASRLQVSVSARSKIAQPLSRTPVVSTKRPPVASSSRLPGLPRTSLHATASKSRPQTTFPVVVSPAKMVQASYDGVASPQAGPSTSKIASPGAVQRVCPPRDPTQPGVQMRSQAAERVFGGLISKSAAPRMPPPVGPAIGSPKRNHSPTRGPTAVWDGSPTKKMSPRKPASPGRIAAAASYALGQLTQPLVSSHPEVKPCSGSATNNPTIKGLRKKNMPPPSGPPILVQGDGPRAVDKEANIPLPAVQIQQITNRHTARNAATYNSYTVVVDRRAGPRPPSPSARLRKQANNLAREERAKKRQAMQETTRKASWAVQSEAAHGTAVPSKRPHARGAGEEEDFESPLKRRKEGEGKTLKWDRGLVSLVAGEQPAVVRSPRRPFSSIIKMPRQLDEHGNALNARAPLSPIVPRESVLIRKVIYDDDL